MNLTTTNSEIHAMVVTTDPELLASFTNISRELGIEVQASMDSQEFTDRLQHGKYEALVLDFDTVPTALPALGSVRKNRPGQHAVIFAVTSKSEYRDKALDDGAHFLLKRPIQDDEIRRTMSLAYDFMLGERRRYFRCAIELPVRLKVGRLGNTLHCSTLNISSCGMAVQTPVHLAPGETVIVECFLTNGFLLRATGIVIWDDKHGKCGLRLRCGTPEIRWRFDSWLDSQFGETKSS